MKRFSLPVLAWLAVLAGPMRCAGQENALLVRIPLTGSPADVPLPVYAHRQDAAGGEYVLVKAAAGELKTAGRPYEILDAQADGARYLLARYRHPEARRRATERFDILMDDGRSLLIRAGSAGDGPTLAELGFEVVELSAQPLVFKAPRPALLEAREIWAMTASPHVRDMLARITTNRLAAAMNELTGPSATVADGSYTNIRTRSTASGRPIQRATSYMYEYFTALGLTDTAAAT
jgi:hypothetical protein